MTDRVILIHESLKESILSDTYTFFMLTSLMIISLYLGSFMAFVAGFMIVWVMIMTAIGKNKRFTIAEARKELDRMESNG